MNPGNVINQLRSKGYRVKVRHKRLDLSDGTFKCKHEFKNSYATNVSPKSGITYVDITKPDSNVTIGEFAACSKNDQYCRKVGLSIALGRALKELGRD